MANFGLLYSRCTKMNNCRHIPPCDPDDDCEHNNISKETINHPPHYGGDTIYEAIKVIEAWDLGFCLGNTVKYISRAGKKNPLKELEDLQKAKWYLNREIERLDSELKRNGL